MLQEYGDRIMRDRTVSFNFNDGYYELEVRDGGGKYC